MRFRTTPKDFRLWIMDLHAVMKRNVGTTPGIAKVIIKLDHDGVHAVATDRYIVVDSALKATPPEGYITSEWLEMGLLSFKSWDLLKGSAGSVHAVEVTDEGLGVFLDQSAIHGDLLDEAVPTFTVEFDFEDALSFPNLKRLIEDAHKNEREIDDNGRDGFRMELVKHIKGVMIEPRSIGLGKPGLIHTQPPRATGIIMPVRIGLEG